MVLVEVLVDPRGVTGATPYLVNLANNLLDAVVDSAASLWTPGVSPIGLNCFFFGLTGLSSGWTGLEEFNNNSRSSTGPSSVNFVPTGVMGVPPGALSVFPGVNVVTLLSAGFGIEIQSKNFLRSISSSVL